jgi:DNA repair exonuclease SbcCD ATPase subunit
MRSLWLALACFALVAPAGFGQDKSAYPFVDLGRAQTLIDVMTKENETLKAEALRLRKEAADLTAQAADTQKQNADLVPLWKAARARYSELAAIEEALVDQGLKAQAAAASAKILPLLKRLAQKVDALGGRAGQLTADAQQRLDQAAVDEARIVRNTDDIILLQASAARTRAQAGRLEAVIAQLDSLSAQAEAALR